MTSVYMVIAAWMPVTVVPTSFATVAIDTFITELSSVIRNCADANVSRVRPAALPARPAVVVTTPPRGDRVHRAGAATTIRRPGQPGADDQPEPRQVWTIPNRSGRSFRCDLPGAISGTQTLTLVRRARDLMHLLRRPGHSAPHTAGEGGLSLANQAAEA